MLVSMDVEPKNNDYDYKKLSEYNDYIILMAYDEYNDSTGPVLSVDKNGLKMQYHGLQTELILKKLF